MRAAADGQAAREWLTEPRCERARGVEASLHASTTAYNTIILPFLNMFTSQRH
jgi:hypothetical protein